MGNNLEKISGMLEEEINEIYNSIKNKYADSNLPCPKRDLPYIQTKIKRFNRERDADRNRVMSGINRVIKTMNEKYGLERVDIKNGEFYLNERKVKANILELLVVKVHDNSNEFIFQGKDTIWGHKPLGANAYALGQPYIVTAKVVFDDDEPYVPLLYLKIK